MTEEQILYIRSVLEDKSNVGITLDKLKYLLLDYFELPEDFISRSCLYNILIREKFSYQRLYTKKIKVLGDDILNLRKTMAKTLLTAFHSRMKIVFTDETAISFNVNLNRSWGKKGERLVKYCKPESVTYSGIVAINQDCIIAFQLFASSVKGDI